MRSWRSPCERSFDERRNKAEDRRNKVVNIHATTQLKVVLVKRTALKMRRDRRPA